MDSDSPLSSEAHDEISMMRTQPLSIIRFSKTRQHMLKYLLFSLPISILAFVLGVLLFGFPFMIFGGMIKWIRYLRKRKTTEEIRPWFRQSSLVIVLTDALGWVVLGAKPSFQAIGSILVKSNLFFLCCLVCLLVYLCIIVCLEINAKESLEQQEKRRQEKERISTLMPKVSGWELGAGVILLSGGILLMVGFQSSLVILSTIGRIVAGFGGFMIFMAFFFTEDLIGLYLRI